MTTDILTSGGKATYLKELAEMGEAELLAEVQMRMEAERVAINDQERARIQRMAEGTRYGLAALVYEQRFNEEGGRDE